MRAERGRKLTEQVYPFGKLGDFRDFTSTSNFNLPLYTPRLVCLPSLSRQERYRLRY